MARRSRRAIDDPWSAAVRKSLHCRQATFRGEHLHCRQAAPRDMSASSGSSESTTAAGGAGRRVDGMSRECAEVGIYAAAAAAPVVAGGDGGRRAPLDEIAQAEKRVGIPGNGGINRGPLSATVIPHAYLRRQLRAPQKGELLTNKLVTTRGRL